VQLVDDSTVLKEKVAHCPRRLLLSDAKGNCSMSDLNVNGEHKTTCYYTIGVSVHVWVGPFAVEV